MKRKIVLTGGGTAGHVTPNMALIPYLKEKDYDIVYVGSYNGMEKKLITDMGIKYYGVSTGKLRRKFDTKNFSDVFRVLKGFSEAKKILKEERPDVIFSKGGYVSVPVVNAAGKLGIPSIIHESDLTPGLANKLCMHSAKKICCNFPETLEHVTKKKAVLTGTPIRDELLTGNAKEGKKICGFEDDKPVLMVIGGSLGAQAVNDVVRSALPNILPYFNVIHVCGKDKVDNMMLDVDGYKQFEFVKSELKDLFALADIVLSRAGANTICELLALRKPNILVPLPKAQGSRGDQILNANSFKKQGFSMVIYQEDLDEDILVKKLHELYEKRDIYQAKMSGSNLSNATGKILKLIDEAVNK